YRFASTRELAAGLRRGRCSAVELAQCGLELLERVRPDYSAVAALMPERALAEAKRADAALKRGQAMAGTRDKPLLGIPYEAKDLLAARGAPTTWGAPPYRDQVFG